MFSSFLFSKRNCRFGEEISEKYSRLNGGSYDTSEPEEPEDQTSPEYAAYQQWFKQLGGFVLASAKPGVSGSDYFPNQFIPSKVKPDGSADVWYTEDIRTRLGTDCAQIDLLVNDPAYTTDANGDIRCNGEIVAELIYVGKEYTLVPETDSSFALKAEKYSCVKAEDGAADYYLENEGANILWEFVRADGKTLISRGNADFFSAENGALKLKYNNKSHFSWVTTNTVQTSEEADINGNLPGSYLLYSGGSSSERKGGYFELEFEFSNGSKESVYLAFSRGDSVKLIGYSTFHNTTLGNTNVLDMNGQWNVSETVREQKYDGYGAHSSYYTDAEFSNAQIDGKMQTVYEVPKGTESNFSMLTQYSTTALSAPFTQYNFAAGSSKPETQTTFNYDSLFTVEFCPEDGNAFFADDSDVKEAKMFKVVAENGNVSYYTINALQNKRDKSIRANVGDFVKSGTAIVEQDSGTQENLSALLDNYGTFSVSLNCMVDASAATVQTGYYTETGTDGNNFHNLKFGNYDIILNVPESAGYEYEVYYFGSGNKVELERSPDNPNAYRLPLRFKNLIGEGNSIELCVSIKKQPQTAWGYMIHRIFQR